MQWGMEEETHVVRKKEQPVFSRQILEGKIISHFFEIVRTQHENPYKQTNHMQQKCFWRKNA